MRGNGQFQTHRISKPRCRTQRLHLQAASHPRERLLELKIYKDRLLHAFECSNNCICWKYKHSRDIIRGYKTHFKKEVRKVWTLRIWYPKPSREAHKTEPDSILSVSEGTV